MLAGAPAADVDIAFYQIRHVCSSSVLLCQPCNIALLLLPDQGSSANMPALATAKPADLCTLVPQTLHACALWR